MALAINDFGGRTGWNCTVGSPPDCVMSGDQILNMLGFNADHLWLAFVGLCALIFGYNGLGYILLRRSKPKFLPLTTATEAAAATTTKKKKKFLFF